MRTGPILSLSQNIPFGVLEFTLTHEEVAILQLISAKNNNAIEYWEKLWQETNDYEDFPFSCKELMPSAVKKIQESVDQKTWQSVTVGNASFLAGLPRYTWTKNQYIINQYKIIAAALQLENIEFIAIKGVCEILASSPLSMMRTSRDIDILIRVEDWGKCKKIFADLGWRLAIIPHRNDFLNNPLHSHAETFYNKEGIIELDVHFSPIAGTKSYARKFTSKLWERKVTANDHPTLCIPSNEDRLIISIANAYNMNNWKNGHTCKYLYDSLFISGNMSEVEIQHAYIEGEKYLKLGSSMKQLIKVLNNVRNDSAVNQEEKRKHLIRFSVGDSFLNWLLRIRHKIELAELLFSGVRTFQTIFFVSAWIANLTFVKLPERILKLFKGSTIVSKNIVKQKNRFAYYLLARCSRM